MQLDWTYPSGFSPNGPLVDRLVYVVYPAEDQDIALLHLQAGSIHAYDSSISNNSVYELSFNNEIEVNPELSSDYRQFTLNCKLFPTNITGYRRALAFALDKFRVVMKSAGGYGEPLDNPIPLSNPFYACEQDVSEHFYYFEPNKANDSLQAAHFIDTSDSPHPGWRYYDADLSGNWTVGDKRGDVLAPDGVKTEVLVAAGHWPSIEAGFELIRGMRSCGLQADIAEVSPDLTGLNSWTWENYGNIGFFTRSLPPPGEPNHLYDLFHSNGVENQYFHFYSNPEYDYNVTMMLKSTTFPESRGWAINCCQILLQDMPMIVCYNEIYNHAYSIDLWEGFVDMVGVNRFGNNPWTLRKVHIKEALGGPWTPSPNPGLPIEYILSLTEGIYSTNVLMDSPYYNTQRVMNQVYSRLWQLDPYSWDPVPDLAWNWSIEPTIASGDIQAGQKFTFNLFTNLTWHDGTPFTSQDVAYNFESIYPLIWNSEENVVGVYRVDALDDYTVEVYTNQSDFFEFSQVTYHYILPKHIWEPYENNSGYAFDWTPETPVDLTGTGPFQWVQRVPGQYVILDRYPDYHFGVERTYTFDPDDRRIIQVLLIAIGIVIIASQVLLLTYLLIRRRQRKVLQR